MRLNDFSVRIIGGRESNQYVYMKHAQKYSLSLHNFSQDPCDADVRIDGKLVGSWRIQPDNRVEIERPAHDTGRFTFYRLGSEEAKQAEIHESSDNGLISVTFKPGSCPKPLVSFTTWTSTNVPNDTGHPPKYWNISGSASSSGFMPDTSSEVNYLSTSNVRCCGVKSGTKAGATGLSGNSNQHFVEVSNLDYFYERQVTIHLRLVEGSGGPRPLTPASPVRETPIPSRI